MKDKERSEKLNIKSLNRCIQEYKYLAKNLNILVLIAIFSLVIYILNKLHIFGVVLDLFTVILPLFIGFVLAWLLAPFANFLVEKKIPRVVSCIIIYVILIGAIFLLLGLVIPNFIDQVKELINATPTILKELKELLENVFSNTDSATIADIKKSIFKTIGNIGNDISVTLPETLIGQTKIVISYFTTFVLGLMISFYLLYDYDKISKNIYRFIPKNQHDNARDLINRINHSLRGYVQGLLLVMLLVFISQAIGLSLAGLKAPLIFALFCAITDIIPYFGPWIGAVPAIIVGFTISPVVGVFTIVSIVVVQTLENNFYQPLIMGHTMELHPVTIMLGLLIFGHFFGIIGMIVATPLVATLKIIFTFTDEKLCLMDKFKNIINTN